MELKELDHGFHGFHGLKLCCPLKVNPK